jgi:hypothetical protein
MKKGSDRRTASAKVCRCLTSLQKRLRLAVHCAPPSQSGHRRLREWLLCRLLRCPEHLENAMVDLRRGEVGLLLTACRLVLPLLKVVGPVRIPPRDDIPSLKKPGRSTDSRGMAKVTEPGQNTHKIIIRHWPSGHHPCPSHTRGRGAHLVGAGTCPQRRG